MPPGRSANKRFRNLRGVAHCLKINDTEAREAFGWASRVLRQKDDTERMEA